MNANGKANDSMRHFAKFVAAKLKEWRLPAGTCHIDGCPSRRSL